MNVGRFLIRQGVACSLFLIGILWIPSAWNSRWADQWLDEGTGLHRKLANGVEQWMREGLDRENFSTGSSLFDGEWLYGTYVMAALGYGQMAIEDPAHKQHYLDLMEEAIGEVLSDRVRQFDVEMWKSDPLESLDSEEGHAAYLGYLNLAMGLHRLIDPESKFIDLNDRISLALRRRIEASPTLLLESYPRETFPVDNCAVIASVALHGRITHPEDDLLPTRWAGRCRRKYMDKETGLLIQCVSGETGALFDYPRGSGTTLGLYFLSFMDMGLSADLYAAVKRELAASVCGFGLVREYPKSVRGEHGDIDSGVVIMGYGLSPTGFALAGARVHEDHEYFKQLYATAHAAGAPFQTKDTLRFVTGASLGDAILFAMLTAQPEGIRGMIP